MALSPDRAAIQTLDETLEAVLAAFGKGPPQVFERMREGLATHAEAVEIAHLSSGPIRIP